MNDLHLKVYDKIDKKIFPVAVAWFNNEGIKTVEIYGKASPTPRKDRPFNPNALSSRTPINRLIRNRIELLMPTGLEDIHGIKIYQGDICKTPNGIRVVIYDAPSFWLAKNIEDKIDVDAFSTPSIVEEVIGNINENPELLDERL